MLAHDIEKKKRTADVYVSENIDFTGMLLSEQVLNGLHDAGFKKPSPIQLKAIPIGLLGFDLIVQSKSGTGKTVIFSVVALQNLEDLKNPQVLILAPTREIALQTGEVLKTIGNKIPGLLVKYFVGGTSEEHDRKVLLLNKIAIIIGTPGRIKSLIKSKHLVTKSIKLLVLDEADKLMLSSFNDDIKFIINKLPSSKQIIATSATYNDSLDTAVKKYMDCPMRINMETDIPTLLGLKQFISIVPSHLNVARQMKIKTDELLRILSNVPFKQCIVFTNYQIRAESLSNNLNDLGWPTKYISASQTQKERFTVLKLFKNFECRVLVSTDLTARGIDIESVNLVINYDIPCDSATYLHRMGRAGRYGSRGFCISICCQGEEYEKFQDLAAQISHKINILKLPSKDSNLPPNLWNCDLNAFEKLFENLNDSTGNGVKEESIDATPQEEKLQNPSDQIDEISKSEEGLELNDETESDFGEPMTQDLSTTPQAVAERIQQELILKRNISLLQISKLLVDSTPPSVFEPYSHFKNLVLNRTELTEQSTSDKTNQNINSETETFIREIKSSENEPSSEPQSSIAETLLETKITDEILSAVEYMLELYEQQSTEYRANRMKYNQIPYKKILKNLLNKTPITTPPNNVPATNSPELLKSKVIFDSHEPNVCTYEQFENNQVKYSAKKKLYELKTNKCKSAEKNEIKSEAAATHRNENTKYSNRYMQSNSFHTSTSHNQTYYVPHNCTNCTCSQYCTCTCHKSHEQNQNLFTVTRNDRYYALDPWYRMWIEHNDQIRHHVQQAMYIRNLRQS